MPTPSPAAPAGPTSHGDGPGSAVVPAPNPAPPPAEAIDAAGHTGFDVDAVVGRVGETVDTYVQPKAAAAVATTFTFPLVLMLLVLIFLVVQPKVDRSDPRLRATADDATTLVDFQDEGLL